MDSWQTIRETTAFENRWVKVRLQTVRLPNGDEYEYSIVDRPEQGVAVFLFDDQERLLLEREYRHAIGQVVWQLPGGLMDKDEPALESAIRELREETGYEATQWVELGEFYDNPGLGNAKSLIFSARLAAPSPVGADTPTTPPQHAVEWDTAESIEMEWVTLAWLREAIQRGEIVERVILSGLGMLWARGWL
jgi:8-oxo-dGTP pyrophosphatase MutT (NUDIX family)